MNIEMMKYVNWFTTQWSALNGCEQIIFVLTVGSFIIGCIAGTWKYRKYARMEKISEQNNKMWGILSELFMDKRLGTDDGKLYRGSKTTVSSKKIQPTRFVNASTTSVRPDINAMAREMGLQAGRNIDGLILQDYEKQLKHEIEKSIYIPKSFITNYTPVYNFEHLSKIPSDENPYISAERRIIEGWKKWCSLPGVDRPFLCPNCSETLIGPDNIIVTERKLKDVIGTEYTFKCAKCKSLLYVEGT